MNIVDVCIIQYPGQMEAGNITFRQPDEEILIDTWNVEGVEQPTEASLEALIPSLEAIYELNQLKASSKFLIQNLLDTTAQSKTYNDALHCVSYGLSTNATWLAEATAFIAWRDDVYETALTILQGVENGDPVPTEQEFLDELPTITWPS
jgi:hypothetical protein